MPYAEGYRLSAFTVYELPSCPGHRLCNGFPKPLSWGFTFLLIAWSFFRWNKEKSSEWKTAIMRGTKHYSVPLITPGKVECYIQGWLFLLRSTKKSCHSDKNKQLCWVICHAPQELSGIKSIIAPGYLQGSFLVRISGENFWRKFLENRRNSSWNFALKFWQKFSWEICLKFCWFFSPRLGY